MSNNRPSLTGKSGRKKIKTTESPDRPFKSASQAIRALTGPFNINPLLELTVKKGERNTGLAGG